MLYRCPCKYPTQCTFDCRLFGDLCRHLLKEHGWSMWVAASEGNRQKLQAANDRLAKISAFDRLHTRGPQIRAASEQSGKGYMLKYVDIFSGLFDEQRDRVAALGKLLHLPTGRILGTQGEPGHVLLAIIDGQADLSARSAVGEFTVRIAGAGEAFPLSSMVDDGRLVVSAVAMTDMKILAIPRDSLMELCSKDPKIGLTLYRAIAGIVTGRYRNTLQHVSVNAGKALKKAGLWANV